MHIFTQRQKRTSQGPSEPPRSVFLSARHRLRLEAQAWLSSSYRGKLWKPSAQEAPQSGCLRLSNAGFPRARGGGGRGGLPASLPQPGAWSLHCPYLSPSRHRCLCLVLGTKPLGRNPTSCRMASVDDQVLEGSREGWAQREAWQRPEMAGDSGAHSQVSRPSSVRKPYHSLAGKLSRQEKAN